jgi:hypothetical protein
VTDRQPATGASSQPVVEMNIPLTQTVDGLIVVTSTVPVETHPDPIEYRADGFFNDLEIL